MTSSWLRIQRIHSNLPHTETISTHNLGIYHAKLHKTLTFFDQMRNYQLFRKGSVPWVQYYSCFISELFVLRHGILDAALNKARVKIAIYMMIATALMAGAAVYSGKKAAQRGDSLALRGMEHHRQLREQAANEKSAAATKSAQ
jgi:hypothetical protein